MGKATRRQREQPSALARPGTGVHHAPPAAPWAAGAQVTPGRARAWRSARALRNVRSPLRYCAAARQAYDARSAASAAQLDRGLTANISVCGPLPRKPNLVACTKRGAGGHATPMAFPRLVPRLETSFKDGTVTRSDSRRWCWTCEKAANSTSQRRAAKQAPVIGPSTNDLYTKCWILN